MIRQTISQQIRSKRKFTPVERALEILGTLYQCQKIGLSNIGWIHSRWIISLVIREKFKWIKKNFLAFFLISKISLENLTKTHMCVVVKLGQLEWIVNQIHIYLVPMSFWTSLVMVVLKLMLFQMAVQPEKPLEALKIFYLVEVQPIGKIPSVQKMALTLICGRIKNQWLTN